MLRHASSQSSCQDGYAECFTRARVKLEGYMRGHALDVSQLADDLKRLPDNVCQTLLCGLPRQLSNEVLAAVRELRMARDVPSSVS